MLISVILPCYNVEKYIDRCLESIVNQTIGVENLEIICVDDCSTDSTLTKLKEWEEKYPENIMVITYEENQRQGGARNIGIQYSSCDWISFVDSDDWIEHDMFEALYEKAETNEYDLVSCKFIRDTGNGIPKGKTQDDKILLANDDKKYHWWDIIDSGNNGEYGGVYTKLYKKEMIVNNDIWFPVHLAYEDNYWINLLMLYVKSIYIIDRVFYHYWVNTDSTIMKKNEAYHLDRLSVEELLIRKYKELGVFELFYSEILWDFLQRYYLGTLFLYFTRFEYCDAKVFNYMKKEMYTIYPNLAESIKPIFQSSLDDKNKLLLSALLSDDNMTDEELAALKLKYIN